MVKHATIAVLLYAASLIYGSDAYYDELKWDKYCSPTPRTLQDDFLKYCYVWVPSEEYCENAVWPYFASSFAFKDPETITERDYLNYFQVIPIITLPNQNLFWSGTMTLIKDLTYTAQMVTSYNSPSGAIINDMGENIYWCGSVESPDGIEYDEDCLCSVWLMFWAQFSITYALAAQETSFYLGYGEREGGMFSTENIFGKYELPNLAYPRVTSLVALDVHQKNKGEACGEGSLIELQNLVAAKGIKYSCYNVYGDLKDPGQKDDIVFCITQMIRDIKAGLSPNPHPCFSPESTTKTQC